MPRRTYDPRNGRRRVSTNHGPAFVQLVSEMTRHRPVDLEPRDCVVCDRSLPPGWRYPEHARCRPGTPNPEGNYRR